MNHDAIALGATLNETMQSLVGARAQLSAAQAAAADLQRRLDEAEAKQRAAEAVPAADGEG